MLKDTQIRIIDKVNNKSITAEVVDTESPFHVEFKENLTFDLQIRLIDTAHEFCKQAYEDLHEIDVVNSLGTTFENLIITSFTLIIDSEEYRFRDILHIKFKLANEKSELEKEADLVLSNMLQQNISRQKNIEKQLEQLRSKQKIIEQQTNLELDKLFKQIKPELDKLHKILDENDL